MKTCTQCHAEKAATEFCNNRARKDGLNSYCKSCKSAHDAAFAKSPIGRSTLLSRQRSYLATKEGREKRRARNLLLQFKITIESYEEMFRKQLGVCAICSGGDLCGRRLAVDHDHATGTIRGLLCRACNTALGFLKDSPELLRTAADYIERSEFKKAEA